MFQDKDPLNAFFLGYNFFLIGKLEYIFRWDKYQKLFALPDHTVNYNIVLQFDKAPYADKLLSRLLKRNMQVMH